MKDYINEAPLKEQHPYEVLEIVYQKCLPYIKEYLKHFTPELSNDMMWSGRASKDVWMEKTIRKNRRPKDTPDDLHERLDDLFLEEYGERYRSNAVFCSGDLSQADGYGTTTYGIFPIGNSYSYCWSGTIKDLYMEIEDEANYFGFSVDEIIEEIKENYRYEAEERLEEMFDEENNVEDFYEDIGEPEDFIEDEEDEDDDGQEAYDEAYSDMIDKAHNEFDDAKSGYINDNFDDMQEELARYEAEELYDQSDSGVERVIGEYQTDDLGGAIDSNSEIMLHGQKYLAVRHDYCMYILRYMKDYKTRKPTKETFALAMKRLDPNKFKKSKRDKDVKRHFKAHINKELMSILGDPL